MELSANLYIRQEQRLDKRITETSRTVRKQLPEAIYIHVRGRENRFAGISSGTSRIIVIRRYGNLGGENLTEQREQKKRSKAGLLAEMHKPSTKRGIRKAQ